MPGELLLICTLLVLWWMYLCFVTQPTLVFDGVGYQRMGRLIYEKGFGAYLNAGPTREPLFPLLVAAAMWMGERCHVAYQYPLRLMGIAALLFTIIFTHRLMLLLKINRIASALGIFYLGFSPTLLNSILWLWSEFAAYPFVVLIVWRSVKSWRFLDEKSNNGKPLVQVLGHGGILALGFIGLMCVKAIAEAVIYMYLISFLIGYISQIRNYGWSKAKPWLVFIMSVLLIFEGFVQGYNWLNFQANGHYQFTDRGYAAFYSNIERRMEPLTLKRLGAAIVMAADGALCVSTFGYSDCAFWTWRQSDDFGVAKAKELEDEHLTDQQKTRYYIQHGLGMMIANPLQSLLIMVIEAHKFFFWETSPNFVTYPDWIERFTYNSRLNLILEFVIAVLCWAGFVTAACMLLWGRNSKWLSRDEGIVLWFVFSFIFWYAAVYSLFLILDRYAFPVVSLMMVLVSFAISRLWRRIKPQHSSLPFHLGLWTSVRICIIFLFLLFVMAGPLIAHIKYQHQRVKEKSKFVSIAFYWPHFPYFASIVEGRSVPEGELMDGYHFGIGYTFYTYFKMAADFFPDSDAAHALLGFCCYYQGNLDQALANYEKALQIKPDFWWNNYNLAVIYFNKSNFNKSAVLLTKLLSLDYQASFMYIHNTPFYQQIWQYMQNPAPVIVNHFNLDTENALLMLTLCYLHLNERSQAVQLAKQVIASGRALHNDRWAELLKIAEDGTTKPQNLLSETKLVNKLAQVRIF